MSEKSSFIIKLKDFISKAQYEGYEGDLQRIDYIIAAYHEDVEVRGLKVYAMYYEETLMRTAMEAVTKVMELNVEAPAVTGR